MTDESWRKLKVVAEVAEAVVLCLAAVSCLFPCLRSPGNGEEEITIRGRRID